MPQKKDKDNDDRSQVELVEFSSMLSCIADLYLTTKVLILLDNSYVGRFWTMMEAWCAMQVRLPPPSTAFHSLPPPSIAFHSLPSPSIPFHRLPFPSTAF